ncbi:MAG: S-layer homology domain-containing protein [Clostridia bacterium]|nr:S-layer homology domain-containing protein [Clostridia bacterium]
MSKRILIFLLAFTAMLAVSVSAAYADSQLPGASLSEREVRSTKSGTVETYREIFKFELGKPIGAVFYFPGDVDTEEEFGYSRFDVYEYSGTDLTVTRYNKYNFIVGKKEFKFDSSGKITYFAEYDKKGRKIYSEKRTFTSSGKAYCDVYSSSDDVSYCSETWENGRLKKAVYYKDAADRNLVFTKSGKFTITYGYDDNGNIVSESRSGNGGYTVSYLNKYPDGQTSGSLSVGDDSQTSTPEKSGTVVRKNGEITAVKGVDGTLTQVEKVNGDAITDKNGKILGIVDEQGNVLVVGSISGDEVLGSDGSVIAKVQEDGTVKYTPAASDGEDEKDKDKDKDGTVAGFEDVFAEDYYAKAVEWATAKNITTGVTKESFAPSGICTRAQVVTFLWRYAGCPEPSSQVNPFGDVAEGSYYEKAVLWAVEKGITNGTSENVFSPEMTCTNAHILKFIWRYAGEPATTEASVIAAANPDKWYTDAAAWADSQSIIHSAGDASYNLNAGCPRADVVYDIYMAELLKNGKKD